MLHSVHFRIRSIVVQRNQIIRLSLVRFATSFLVVLLVGVLNRIMINELSIGKTTVGFILSLLHLVTPLALYFGFLSDNRPLLRFRRIPYIVIGMFLCCAPLPFLPDVAQKISESSNLILFGGLGVLVLMLIGFGITISTIALHALIVDRCPDKQRGEAMTIVWIVTLAGFIFASLIYSWLIPDYDHADLRMIFIVTAVVTMAMTFIGVWKQESRNNATIKPKSDIRKFGDIFKALSKNPQARLLFLFIALSDFFFFSQEYVLEPFGKDLFGMSVAYTTSFSLYFGIGTLISMIGINALYNLVPTINEKTVVILGCVIISLSFGLLSWSAFGLGEVLILIAIFSLGFGKGLFNVGIARIMVKAARDDLSGMIMGLWAAIGGIAIGFGELSGAAIVDLAIHVTGSNATGYGILFISEGIGLLICIILIMRFALAGYHRHLNERLPTTISPEWI